MQRSYSNIFTEFIDVAEHFSSKDAIVHYDKDVRLNFTYEDLLDLSLRFDRFLTQKNIESEDKVAILMGNHPGFAVSFLGVMSVGAVVVPLDIQFSDKHIEGIISHSGVKAIIFDKSQERNFSEKFLKPGIVLIDYEEFSGKSEDMSSGKGSKEKDGQKPAAIFYTSGTTDEPKGVVLKHSNILSNIKSLHSLNVIKTSDRIISILPLHHAYAFTTTLLLPLLSGSTVIYPEGISSSSILSCINDAKVSVLVAVPQIFAMMARAINNKIDEMPGIKKGFVSFAGNILYLLRRGTGINLSKILFSDVHKAYGGNLRLLVSGGARLDSNVAKSFLKWGFSIVEGYGLTETSPVAAFDTPLFSSMGSVGRALPDVQIKIHEPNEKGIGEVLIKGPNVMAGYYKKDDATNQVIKDGWFYSGDLGYLGKNRKLYLVGRKKDTIVLSSGKNIDPEDVEEIYAKSSYIKEVCVFPIRKEGFLAGVEHLAAVIVVDEKSFVDKVGIDEREVIKKELERLASNQPTYKHISSFVVTRENLPRTALGKIMRHRIEDIFTQAYAGPFIDKDEQDKIDANLYNSEISMHALAAVRDILKKDVKINDHLELDLGLDSLSRIDVLLSIQDRLGLSMSDDQTMDFFISSTVKEMLDKLEKYFPSGKAGDEHDVPHKWDDIINQDPSEETIEKISIKTGFFMRTVNAVMLLFIKIFLKVFFLLKVEGKENLKGEGPYLICPNHASYLDGFIVLSGLPVKVALDMQFVGYSFLFKNVFLKYLVKTGNIIPIDSGTNLVEALRACTFALKRSKIVCYFPEGQRSFDGEINDFKKGIGILIKELNVPVVPVYIDGAYDAWPRTKKFPRLLPLKIRFGKPVNLEDLSDKTTENDDFYDILSRNLRAKVLQLKKSIQ